MSVSFISTSVVACTNPVISATSTNLLCYNGNNGTITLSVSGGTSPYSFAWTGPSGFTSASQNLTGLVAGTYTVVVAGGTCSSTTSVTITQPAVLTVTASGVACIGSTMNLYSTPGGGTTPYTYSWTGPGAYSSTSQNPIYTNPTYASAGNYTVTVKDSNNCSVTATATVGAYLIPVLSSHATDVSCNGGSNGSVSLSVSGGTNFSYLWTGPSGFISHGQNIASLVAGVYTVLVTSNTGCTNTNTDTVAQYAAVTALATSNSPVCTGQPLYLSGQGTGGTGSYSYSWTGPNGFASTSQSPTLNPATVAESGTYTLTVKDAFNCFQATSINVPVTNGGVLTDTITNVLCNGTATGAINLGVTGITGVYNVFWVGPNGYTSGSQNISGLQAGSYGVDVEVPQGCINHLNATITQGAPILLNASFTHPVCSGAALQLTSSASAGTGPFTYTWAGPNGFAAPTQNATIPSVSFMGTGTYILTAKDANNCIKADTLHVVVDSTPVLNISYANELCQGGNNGWVNVTAAGSGPFTYVWTGPGNFTARSQNISNVPTGLYNVAVTSAVGCTASNTTFLSEPPAITGTATASGPICAGAILSLAGAANGGTGTLSYSWAGPNGFAATGQNTTLTTTAASIGQYALIVQDQNGCVKTFGFIPDILPPPVAVPVFTQPLCNGDTDGSIAVNITGGIAPFYYSWAGPRTHADTTQAIHNLAAGTYYVTITGGCQVTYVDTIQLMQPTALAGSPNIPVACAEDTLHVGALITGGTQPYTYSWTGPAGFTAHVADTTLKNITAGNEGIYTLNLYDAHGCTLVIADTAIVKPSPTVNAGNDTAICAGNSAVLTAASNYPYLWSTGDTTRSITVNKPGAYSVTVTALNGCSATDSVFVRVDSTPRIGGIHATVPTPFGSDLVFSAVNAQYIIVYSWDFGDGSTATSAIAPHDYATKGTYTVTLIGSNACGSDTITTTVVVDTLTGVPVVAAAGNAIKIYPNPAQGHITIDAQRIKLYHLRLATITGAVVYTENVWAQGLCTVNTGQLASGLYILYMDTDAGMVARKVTIAR